ncbi:MAG: beta-L-arabinofuranosidase domain-containing protein [Bacteroidota bacterium]
MRHCIYFFYIMTSLFITGGNVHAQAKLYPNEFPLSEVKLLDGPFKHARDLNIQTLLKYDVDRLLQPYLKEAGLPEKGKQYASWAGLAGHIGGHYLSALAMSYASTGDTACKRRMDYTIATLTSCQNANTANHADWGRGYVGGVPDSKTLWTSFQKGDFTAFHQAWVPWYNLHKMYAGLRDAWLYTGNDQAKEIFLKFCNWGIQITSSLSNEQMQSMLDTEQGGMNEIFADAYQMTGDEKYINAAKRFSHNMLLDAMASDNDNLDNKHANTQVPKAVGFARIAELTHDKKYGEAGSFFWQTVTNNRTLAFGGNSRREFFPSAAACNEFISDVEGPESCNSYNMLKLTEDLFRINPAEKYTAYYERTLYNHILSAQDPVNGGYVYFTPVRPRHYRVYSAPNEAMWCCVGSGMENPGKYGQFIYTHQHDSLFVNLFVASELNWKEKNIKLRQSTSFPYEEKTKLIIQSSNTVFTLMVRYPSWVKDGALKITVNNKAVIYSAQSSSYIGIKRLWRKGDVIEIMLPMHNSIEHLPNVPNYIAFLHGPILLGAKTGTEDLKGLLADDSRWGHIASGKKLPVDKAPIIIYNDVAAANLKPVDGKPLNFIFSETKMANPADLLLQPFYTIHDARYMIYWMALNNNQYQMYIDSIEALEKEKLALEKRTIDFVAPGEQQPEADHSIEKINSNTGNYLDEFWRDARNEGYFSYRLTTSKQTDITLVVRYWGNESGDRSFGIYIDDEKLVTENITGKWNQQKFIDVVYTLPEAMIKDKEHIIVKFKPLPGNTAGAVYHVALLRKKSANE